MQLEYDGAYLRRTVQLGRLGGILATVVSLLRLSPRSTSHVYTWPLMAALVQTSLSVIVLLFLFFWSHARYHIHPHRPRAAGRRLLANSLLPLSYFLSLFYRHTVWRLREAYSARQRGARYMDMDMAVLPCVV